MDNTKKTKKKIAPVFIIALICLFAGTVFICVLLINNVRQKRMETQIHISNATNHIKSGLAGITVTAEMVANFYVLINQAENLIDNTQYDAAIDIYEEAKSAAVAVSYTAGVILAESGIENAYNLIKIAKRNEAMNLFVLGNDFYNEGLYAESLEFFNQALSYYIELEDHQNIVLTLARINYAEQKILETHEEQSIDAGNIDNTQTTEVMSNYEHNINIHFDLQTLIDNQNRRPASQIRMGQTEGLNEGWYNGCGWVAVYNALILLGNPEHPAEIVRYFETNAGTVFGGVFGTYPTAIEGFLKSLGYNVNQTIFPQISLNIDDEIKASKVSILAYTHTNAAHYIAVIYNEEIEKFVIYNDSFARTRAESLGFQDLTDIGAPVDSVSEFINNTRNILFSFSLIVVS